jgi:hypothetical protein
MANARYACHLPGGVRSMIADFLAQKWPYSCRRAAAGGGRLARMAKDRTDQGEPPLDELLEDPIARALMASDGVERRDVERLLARKRRSWFETEPE